MKVDIFMKLILSLKSPVEVFPMYFEEGSYLESKRLRSFVAVRASLNTPGGGVELNKHFLLYQTQRESDFIFRIHLLRTFDAFMRYPFTCFN